jgi:hypothetical protein
MPVRASQGAVPLPTAASHRPASQAPETAPAAVPRFLLNVTVPLGSEGDIHVPLFEPQQEIWETGALVYANRSFFPSSPGVVSATVGTRFVAFATLSGDYQFQVRL